MQASTRSLSCTCDGLVSASMSRSSGRIRKVTKLRGDRGAAEMLTVERCSVVQLVFSIMTAAVDAWRSRVASGEEGN